MTIRLACDGARVEIDPDAGGRITSLQLAGFELLVSREPNPLAWGCYPMAPFAGRVRHGRFRFRGAEHALPLGLPPHAIHGTTFTRAWIDEGGGRLSTSLGDDWPFAGGRAVQQVTLAPGLLTLRLEVHAEAEPFPASLGWHPWFRRRLAAGSPAELAFRARWMHARDADDIPSDRLVPPPPGPWDDCFSEVEEDPRITWPGALHLMLRSSARHWVVYDQPAHALCVEPVTAVPDALNGGAAQVVEPGSPLVAEMTFAWSPDRQ